MLNLSRCPRKTQKAVNTEASSCSKNSNSLSKLTVTRTKTRKRRRPESKFPSLPIPSFRTHDSSELKKMERAFLDEDCSSEEETLNRFRRNPKQMSPIPDFNWKNNDLAELGDSDDDLSILPVFHIKKTPEKNLVTLEIAPALKDTEAPPITKDVEEPPIKNAKKISELSEESKRIVRSTLVDLLHEGSAQNENQNPRIGLDNDYSHTSKTNTCQSTVAQEKPASLAIRDSKEAKSSRDSKSQTAITGMHSDFCMVAEQNYRATVVTEHANNFKKQIRQVTTKEEFKSNEEAKRAPPPHARKRNRKGSCALCMTCSCQNRKVDEASAILDLKIFSRSDAAIEKALIRRLQKNEKSVENFEVQTEMVRRKLRKHRRQIFRKKQNIIPQKAEKAYFLPDAEEFEAQPKQCAKVAKSWVQQAQQSMFPTIPDHQQTLTQLGFPSSKGDGQITESKEESETMKSHENITKIFKTEQSNAERGGDNDWREAMDDSDETLDQEQETNDKIRRFHWPKGVKSDSNDVERFQSQSLWRALTTMQEVDDQKCSYTQADTTKILCPWDRLFVENTQGKELDDDGIDQLFDLFNASSPLSSYMEIPTTEQAIKGLTLLSQQGEERATSICSSIKCDKSKLSAIGQACPNWKENVSFAFLQKDQGEILNALRSLRQSRSKMMETKQKILESWGRHQLALDVFETALESSLDRLKSKKDDHLEAVEGQAKTAVTGGFMTQCS